MNVTIRNLWEFFRPSREEESERQMTMEEICAEMHFLALEHLGVSGEEALRMLDRGDLEGTAIEVELRGRLFLLGQERPRNPRSEGPVADSGPRKNMPAESPVA